MEPECTGLVAVTWTGDPWNGIDATGWTGAETRVVWESGNSGLRLSCSAVDAKCVKPGLVEGRLPDCIVGSLSDISGTI